MSASAPDVDPATLDWLTLDEDEEVIWTGKPHESSLVPALVVGVPLSIFLIGLLIIASAYLTRENTEYVVTTDALYKKRGILSRDVQRIDFGKVQNTSYSQGFFGSHFGYGNVDVSTAGGSGVEMQFQSVPEPRQVQELINKRVKAGRSESTTEAGETKEDVLDDILTELRAIRETLENQQAQLADLEATAQQEQTEPGTAAGQTELHGTPESAEGEMEWGEPQDPDPTDVTEPDDEGKPGDALDTNESETPSK